MKYGWMLNTSEMNDGKNYMGHIILISIPIQSVV